MTNKPDAFTQPLLAGARARLARGLRGERRSAAATQAGSRAAQARGRGARRPPERCVYVGDAPRDIEAGKDARMATIAAAYGYIRPREDPIRGARTS